jgi:hypothetical protein
MDILDTLRGLCSRVSLTPLRTSNPLIIRRSILVADVVQMSYIASILAASSSCISRDDNMLCSALNPRCTYGFHREIVPRIVMGVAKSKLWA